MGSKIRTPISEIDAIIPTSQEILKLRPIWNRLEALFENDEDELKEYCKRFPNESSDTYAIRKDFYTRQFINPAPDMVAAPVNAVVNKGAKVEIVENGVLDTFDNDVVQGEVTENFKTFRKKYVLPDLKRYGSVCIVLDKPSNEATSLKEEKLNGIPYLTMIRLQDIINYEIVNNEFEWFAYEVKKRKEWSDPLKPPQTKKYIYIYTKTELKIYEGNKLVKTKPHDFGFVPVVIGTMEKANPSDVFGITSMFQTSNMIYTMNDHISKLNTDILKSNSTMAISEEALSNINSEVDRDGRAKTKKRDNDGFFVYEGENGPEYIKVDIDVSQRLEMIALYKTAAIENEKINSTESKLGAKGQTVAQSGYSKILDREPLKASLIALAMTEKEIVDSVFKMVAEVMDNGSGNVKRENESRIYEPNIDYDLKPLDSKLDEIKKWIDTTISGMSPTITKSMLKNLVPNITDVKEEIDGIIAEIDTADEANLNSLALKLVEMEQKNKNIAEVENE